MCLLFFAGSRIVAQEPSPLQAQVLAYTNAQRIAAGLSTLRWSPALAAAAERHSEGMARANDLAHLLPGEEGLAIRAARAGAHFQAVAENIAYGPSAETIEVQWMQSVPHRQNILDPRMNAIGISLFASGDLLWATEDFAESTEALSLAQVEAAIASELLPEGIVAAGQESAQTAEARTACPLAEGNVGAARFTVRFETSSLGALPQPLLEAAASHRYTLAAVGACAPVNPRNQGFGAYRVAVLLF